MTDQQKEIFLPGVAVGINRTLNRVWDVMASSTKQARSAAELLAGRAIAIQIPDEAPILEEIKKDIDTYIKIKSN